MFHTLKCLWSRLSMCSRAPRGPCSRMWGRRRTQLRCLWKIKLNCLSMRVVFSMFFYLTCRISHPKCNHRWITGFLICFENGRYRLKRRRNKGRKSSVLRPFWITLCRKTPTKMFTSFFFFKISRFSLFEAASINKLSSSLYASARSCRRLDENTHMYEIRPKRLS